MNTDAITDNIWFVPARAKPVPDPKTPIADLSITSFTFRILRVTFGFLCKKIEKRTTQPKKVPCQKTHPDRKK